MITNNRLWVIGASIVMAAVLAMGWFIGASPLLATAAADDAQRESVEAQNAGHEARLAQIKEEFANIASYRGELAELQAAVPPSGDLSTFLGQLHDLELASGVSVASINVGGASPFIASAPAEGADPASTDESEFIYIDINLSVTGDQGALLDFLDALQGGTRLYLVKGLTMSSDAGVYTASIDGSVYVLLDPTQPIFPEDADVVEGEQVTTTP